MEWANRMVMTVAELSHIDTGASQKALKINSPLEVHESSNPQLTVEQKAELAKQRKQSKMKALNRTARGNSFQKQQLELGMGRPHPRNPKAKTKTNQRMAAEKRKEWSRKKRKRKRRRKIELTMLSWKSVISIRRM